VKCLTNYPDSLYAWCISTYHLYLMVYYKIYMIFQVLNNNSQLARFGVGVHHTGIEVYGIGM